MLIIKPLMPHKIMNFIQWGKKNSVKDLVFICSIQYKDIIPFQLPVPVLKWFKAPTAWFELKHWLLFIHCDTVMSNEGALRQGGV